MSEIQKWVETNNNQDYINEIPQGIKELEWFNDFINRFQDRKSDIFQLLSDKSKSNRIIRSIVENESFPIDENQLEEFFIEFWVDMEIKKANDTLRVLSQIEINYELKEKDWIDKEKDWIDKEKDWIDKEKDWIDKEKDLIDKEIIEQQQLLSWFVTSINELKFNDPKFNSFVQEITSEFEKWSLTVEKINQINQKITNYLKEWNNLQTLLDSAKKSWWDNFDRIKKYVWTISSNDSELKTKFDDWLSKNQTVQALGSPIREIEMREYFWKDYIKAEKTWDLLILWDKILDTGTKPPTAYIKGEWKYLLETELPKIPSEHNEKRKKWHEKKQEIISEVKNRSTNLTQLEDKLKKLEAEYIDEKTDWNEDRLKNIENQIKDTKLVIEQIKKEIVELISKARVLDTEMMEVLTKIEFKDKEQREWKEEKTRQTLSFLHEIWFDLLPQSATDYVINQINSNPNMMWLFTSPIDLKNWELWNTTLWWWLSVESKVKFTDFLSDMLGLTWDDKLDYYKVQRWYFWAKIEWNWVWLDWLKKYINLTLWEDSKISWQELYNNLTKKE